MQLLGAYCGEKHVSLQDSNLPSGIYKIIGTDSSSPDTDDGVLIVAGGHQIKIGINYARFAVRSTYATNWNIS